MQSVTDRRCSLQRGELESLRGELRGLAGTRKSSTAPDLSFCLDRFRPCGANELEPAYLDMMPKLLTYGKLKAGDASVCWNGLVTLNSVEAFVIGVSIKAEHLCWAPGTFGF